MDRILAILLACVALGVVGHWAAMRLLAWRGVRVRRTMFGLTLLFDTTDDDGTPVRMLSVGGAFQSVCYLAPGLENELVCEYQRLEARIVAGLPRLRDAVVIGGGGFSFPRWLVWHLPPVRVTTIEIDPAIIEIARSDFFLRDAERAFAGTGRLDVVCADGWEWLRARSEPVDLIVNEAFKGRRPFGPLATDEGARLVRERLSAGGTYLADVRCPLEGRGSETLGKTAAAFAREFAHVWVLPEFPDEPKRPGNNTLVASDCDLVAAGCAPLVGREWGRGR